MAFAVLSSHALWQWAILDDEIGDTGGGHEIESEFGFYNDDYGVVFIELGRSRIGMRGCVLY